MINNLKQLTSTSWDACILGDGVSAMLLSQYLRSKGQSVLWITGGEEFVIEKATLQNAWLWNLSNIVGANLAERLFEKYAVAFDADPFEIGYFGSSRRMRKPGELEIEWGEHEAAYFNNLSKNLKDNEMVDIAEFVTTVSRREFESLFEKVVATPVVEIKAIDGKISSIVLAQLNQKKKQEFEVTALNFFVCEPEEFLHAFHDKSARSAIAATSRGKSFHPGFGLKFNHSRLANQPEQSVICPLIVNPSKKADIGHLCGYFEGALSYWFGFLTPEEVEDNGAILKKIKHAKRAIERAVPGFVESITNETITFEMKMFVTEKRKLKTNALGAALLTDKIGAEIAMQNLLKAINAA